MKKIKRKARTKLSKNVDMLKPIDILSFGSEDDPCFGKHFKPQIPECARCGDSELCAMKMAQLAHIKRDELERGQAFKDMEEQNIPEANKAETRKSIKARIKELVKISKTGIKEDEIINDVYTIYSKDGFTKKTITKILKKVVETSNYITEKNNKLIWKKP